MNSNLLIYLTFATIATGAVVVGVILANLSRIKEETNEWLISVKKTQ